MRRLIVAAALGLAFVASVSAQSISEVGATAQPPRAPVPTTRQIPVGTAAISGTVVAADTGQPVRLAIVTLNGETAASTSSATGVMTFTSAGAQGPGLSRTAVTDGQGHFSFDDLPAGQFRVTVTRNGFLSLNYGQTKPDRPGSIIPIAAGQRQSLAVRLIRGGVITGLVFDDNGQPAAGAQLQAMQLVSQQGVKRLSWSCCTQSDDRGQYRITGLSPGEYFVTATPNSYALGTAEHAEMERAGIEQAMAAANASRTGPPAVVTVPLPPNGSGEPGYLPTYYPSAMSAGAATSVTLGAGEEKTGIDIRLLLIQGTNLTVTVVSPVPAPDRLQAQVINQDPALSANMSFFGGGIGADGSFHIRNVAPGQYMVNVQTSPAGPGPSEFVDGVPTPVAARPRPADVPRLFGRAPITIDGQSQAVVSITLQPGRSISGQVLFEGTRAANPASRPMMVEVSSALQQNLGAPPPVMVGPDGHFVIENVFPGTYSLRVNSGDVKYVKSSVVNGVDSFDFPFVFDGDTDITNAVITISDRLSTVSGALSDTAGKPLPNYSIVLAAADTRFWTPASRRIRVTESDANGHYAFAGVPAGDYWIAAVPDMDPGSQFDPEFLKAAAASSVRVTLGDGATDEQNIRLAQ